MRKFTAWLAGAGMVAIVAVAPVGSASAEQACIKPPDGLVGWWTGDGDFTDIAGGNDGTEQGTVPFVVGNVSDAFDFDGNLSNYVRVPNDPVLEPANITVDAWIRGVGNAAPTGYFVSHRAVACSRASYAIYNLGPGVRFYIGTSTTFIASPPIPDANWNDGGWHHVAGTFDGASVCVYFDGALVGCTTPSTPPTIDYTFATNTDLNIGAYRGSCNIHTTADVDELEIFNRALSLEEIAAIHGAGSLGKCKAPPPDHFKCYEVEDSTRLETRPYVSLEDQFGLEEGVKVQKPKYFCNPVDKNGEGISNMDNTLTCYEIDTDQPTRTVDIENQFGAQTLVIDNAELLCVPSKKLNVSDGDLLDDDDDDDHDDDDD